MKKYIFYTFDSPIDEKEISVSGEIKNPISIAIALANRGNRVTIITNKPNTSKLMGKKMYKGMEIIYFRDMPFFGVIRYLLRSVCFYLITIFYVRKRKRIIVSHSCYATLLISGVRFITPHGTNIPEYKAESHDNNKGIIGKLKLLNSKLQGKLDSYAMSKAHTVLSVSRFQMNEMNEIYGINCSNMRLAYNIPLCITLKLKPNNEDKVFDFLYVGRLAQKKGLNFILDLSLQHTNSTFVVVGGTNFFRTISETLFQKLSNSPNIKLLMDVTELELATYYSKSKILLVPSIGYESLPTVILEALNYNCLPVAPSSWGNIEILTDKFLYNEGEWESFCTVVDNLKSQWNESAIDLNKINKRLDELYDNTISIYELK